MTTPRPKAAARQATRMSLLRSATQMLLENPVADPIRSLRPVDVARRADPPRTHGAFYNIWPTQEDFRLDLLEYIYARERNDTARATVAAVSDLLADDGLSTDETVRTLADLNFDLVKFDLSMRLKQVMWAQAADDLVRDLLDRLYNDVTDDFAAVFDQLLIRRGRRYRAPFTARNMVVTLVALAEGLHLRWVIQPEEVPDALVRSSGQDDGAGSRDGRSSAPEEGEWSLFATVTRMVVLGMTEPDPDADQR